MDYRVYDRLDKASYDVCHAACSAEQRKMTYEELRKTDYKRYDYPWYGGNLESALLLPDLMTKKREVASGQQ